VREACFVSKVVRVSQGYLDSLAGRCVRGTPTRLASSSAAICATTSHRLASAAKISAHTSAVWTTFDSSYASDDSVTTPRTIAHLGAPSDTLTGSASVLIVPDDAAS
jgi:hypothetical protein